jgi:hypothetical protein
MPGHGEKLTRKAEAAIAALMSEPTVEAAAIQARVSHATLKNWLKRPASQQAYRAARRQIVEAAVIRVQQMAMAGTAELHKLLRSRREPIRLKAATTILTFAIRGLEQDDLVTRVENLEEAARNRAGAFSTNGFAPRSSLSRAGTV